MALFRVAEIKAGNKIQVANGWEWGGDQGTDVIIAGYNPTQGNHELSRINEELAKNRLSSLIQGKEVELGRVVTKNNDGSITCVTYYNGVDIAKYFPEYTQASHI